MATTVLATAVALVLTGAFNLTPIVPFFAAVAFTTWRVGPGPGALAVALGGLACVPLLLVAGPRPSSPLLVAGHLASYVLVAALICALITGLLRAQRRAVEQLAQQSALLRDARRLLTAQLKSQTAALAAADERRAVMAADAARLARELEQVRTGYRALFDGGSEAMVLADAAGRIIDVNRPTRALLGYGPEEPIPGRMADLIAERGLAPTQTVDAGRWRSEVMARRRDGSLIHVEVLATLIRLPTEAVYFTVLRDLSPRRAIQRVQKDLVDLAARELKGPLAALRTYAGSVRPARRQRRPARPAARLPAPRPTEAAPAEQSHSSADDPAPTAAPPSGDAPATDLPTCSTEPFDLAAEESAPSDELVPDEEATSPLPDPDSAPAAADGAAGDAPDGIPAPRRDAPGAASPHERPPRGRVPGTADQG